MHIPHVCPRGHELTPGRVVVGWHPCICPATAQRGRGLLGHRTWRCRSCEADGVSAVCYDPPHAAE